MHLRETEANSGARSLDNGFIALSQHHVRPPCRNQDHRCAIAFIYRRGVDKFWFIESNASGLDISGRGLVILRMKNLNPDGSKLLIVVSVWRGFGEGIIYFGIMSRGGLLSWPDKQLKKVEPFEKKICRVV